MRIETVSNILIGQFVRRSEAEGVPLSGSI